MILKYMFHDKVFNQKLLSLMFPITLQNLMLALVAAGDAAMLGAVHQDAMAAVSLATQIQFIQNMIIYSITTGVGVLGAQYWGKNDRKVLGQIFSLSVRESLLVSVVFFIGCYFYPEYLMKLFAGDQTLIGLGAEYLRIAAWSYLLTGVSQCYLAIMRVSEHAGRSAWISSGTVILNILLNAVFIFGLFGFPAMGVKGAALATLLARIIELIWCFVSSLKKTYIRLQIREMFHYHFGLIAEFWRYAASLLGACLLWGVGFTAYTAIIGHLGKDAAAANSIAAVARDLMCCVCNGLAGGIGIMIGNELGAGRLARGKKYGQRALGLSVISGLLSMVVILASIPLVSRFMKLTEQAHEYMVGMFIILSIYMIGRTICTVVINGIFDAGGDTLFDVYSLVVAMWCFALPCALLSAFVFHLPVLVAYGCTCLDEVGKIPWVIHHYRKYKWVRNITKDSF